MTDQITITVSGPQGSGKSRLVAELLQGVAGKHSSNLYLRSEEDPTLGFSEFLSSVTRDDNGRPAYLGSFAQPTGQGIPVMLVFEQSPNNITNYGPKAESPVDVHQAAADAVKAAAVAFNTAAHNAVALGISVAVILPHEQSPREPFEINVCCTKHL